MTFDMPAFRPLRDLSLAGFERQQPFAIDLPLDNPTNLNNLLGNP